MQPGVYDYIAQDRVLWGTPAAEAITAETERRAAQRVFIVASRTLNRKTDVVTSIADALDKRLVGVFDECREHTPRDTVIAAAEAVRAAQPDLIVSVGGGTVIDTVKVMLVALAQGVRTVDGLDDWHIRVNEDGSRHVPQVGSPPLRQIAVPTTLSGAEFSSFGGCTDPRRKVKHGFTGREIGPAAVILDPAATLHTPEWLWLSTGIRAVDHAVESICSIAPAPLVDGCALHALRLLREALPRNRAEPDELAARQQAMHGAWLASQGILRVHYGASHGIGHSLGAATGVSHGHTSCVLLPAVLRWNRQRQENAERQEWVAEALGRRDGDAARAVEDLIRSLGLPVSLRELKVTREQFPAVAEGAMGNLWVRTNPRPVETPDDVLEILELAY
ncbi:MAG: iron-containing alcohol dehydrogenase [Ectothiorhodospiraceae bacterium]|nr:iron-containing alcohol dehydrogenase [Ectothiorhodospiraceae bacterium]MCH8503312.1 iron-containing alcohol dehydrogenase [Ectothiorhodospiraceae bacterium]